MIKSFAALSITTGVRLLTGLVLFVLMAREWPAVQFGQFMYLFSVAALLVLACEFGFTQQILKEIGQAPDLAKPLMGRYLGAKLWLTLATTLLALAFAWASALNLSDALQLAMLLAGGVAMSYADFYMACFRALGSFGQEARLTIKGNLIYFALAAAALYAQTGPIGVAAGLLLARLIHLGMAYRLFQQRMHASLPIALHHREVAQTIKASSAYGADVAVGAAFVNIDTILIAHALGAESVAAYQIVARFYQGACLLPPIFGSIFLPKLAHAFSAGSKDQTQLMLRKMHYSLLGSGVAGMIAFNLALPLLNSIYPSNITTSPSALMPWFGLLLLVRFVAASQGIAITAAGGQKFRTIVFIGALTLLSLIALPMLRHLGLLGMIASITASYALISLAFWVWNSKAKASDHQSMIISHALIAASCVAYLFVYANR